MNQDKAYWREVNPPKDYTDEDLIYEGMRIVALRRVRQAVENGTLVRADTCSVCERKEMTVAHHWNGYDRPFDVWWVCRKCNANLPHDRHFTLEKAREFIKKKYVGQWYSLLDAHKKYYRWREPCDACGVWYPLWLMEDWDGVLICQYCSPDRE